MGKDYTHDNLKIEGNEIVADQIGVGSDKL